MDILVEILLDVYGELMLLVIPGKSRSRKYALIARGIAVLVLLGVFALVLWGVWLLDGGHMAGIAPITVAAAISVAQITAGIVLTVKRHRRSKE